MPEKVIDISALYPEKVEVKECHGRNEEVNRDNLLKRCGSVIFPEDRVKYIEDYTTEMPEMTPDGKGGPVKEKVSWWWHTKNDKDFDTIGFFFDIIDHKQTLLCGDCEFGPLGLRTMDDKEFRVAVERVRYVDKPRKDPKVNQRKPRSRRLESNSNCAETVKKLEMK